MKKLFLILFLVSNLFAVANETVVPGATLQRLYLLNYNYSLMQMGLPALSFGLATNLNRLIYKNSSGTMFKLLTDASGSSNTSAGRIFYSDGTGAATNNSGLLFDGTSFTAPNLATTGLVDGVDISSIPASIATKLTTTDTSALLRDVDTVRLYANANVASLLRISDTATTLRTSIANHNNGTGTTNTLLKFTDGATGTTGNSLIQSGSSVVITPTSNTYDHNNGLRIKYSPVGMSELVLGATDGWEGTGRGQWTLFTLPLASGHKYGMTYNATWVHAFDTLGNVRFGPYTTQTATATPTNISLDDSYSNGATNDKLKIYLMNNGTSKYGFGLGPLADIQYHSQGYHDFYVDNVIQATISSTGLGIGKTPTAPLDVAGLAKCDDLTVADSIRGATGTYSGAVTATGFTGPLTGNVTGNTSGSSGSCTGNAATVTDGVYTTGAGTVFLAPSGSAAALTSFPTLNQNTTGNATTATTAVNLSGGSVSGTTGAFSSTVQVDSLKSTKGINATGGTFTGALSGTTLNTGNGANELYAMNQSVKTDANVVFNYAAIPGGISAGSSTFLHKTFVDSFFVVTTTPGKYIHIGTIEPVSARYVLTNDYGTASNQLSMIGQTSSNTGNIGFYAGDTANKTPAMVIDSSGVTVGSLTLGASTPMTDRFYVDSTYYTTLGGFTGTVYAKCRFVKIGNQVTFTFGNNFGTVLDGGTPNGNGINGESNSVEINIPIPAIIRPSAAGLYNGSQTRQVVPFCLSQYSSYMGSTPTPVYAAKILYDGTTINLFGPMYTLPATGTKGWTTGDYCTITYTLLR